MLCKNHQSRSIPVQTPDGVKVGEPLTFQTVQQRIGVVSGRRMDHNPGRFIHSQDIFILIDHQNSALSRDKKASPGLPERHTQTVAFPHNNVRPCLLYTSHQGQKLAAQRNP